MKLPLAFVKTIICLALIMTLIGWSNHIVYGQEVGQASSTPNQPSTNPVWESIVQPETDDPGRLLEFIQSIKSRKPRTPDQYIEMQTAIRTAAKKILEQSDRASPATLKLAESEFIASSVLLLSHDGEDAKQKTFQRFFEYLTERNPINEHDQQLVVLLGQNAELSGNAEEAIQTYSRIIQILETKKDAKLAGFITFLQSANKRLKLIDHQLELKTVTIDGQPFDIESLRGSYAVICFWATFSPPSVAELKRLRELHDRFTASELRIVSIAIDEPSEGIRTQIGMMKLPWTHLWDQASVEKLPLSFELGISAVPSMILLDRDSTVIALQTSSAAVSDALVKIFEAEKKGP